LLVFKNSNYRTTAIWHYRIRMGGVKKDFKDLRVWQVADKLFVIVLKDCQKFPKNRIAYFLSDQLLRAIGSISANIAEGHGRGGDRELQRSLIIARGEISEARSWIAKLVSTGYINHYQAKKYEDEFQILSKMITVFIGEIRKRLKKKL